MPASTMAKVSEAPAPRVLLVEHSDDNREMYAAYLTHAGCKIAQAASAAEALRLMAHERPDLIVTDIVLPNEDGLEFCRHVRAHPEWDATPVIALTGLTMTEDDVEAALDAGSSIVLFKPCLPERLHAEITRVLESSAQLRADPAESREHGGVLVANAPQLRDRTMTLQARSRRLLEGLGQKDLIDRIDRAYEEMPTLSLSVDQARRLWNTDRVSCQIAMRALVDAGRLRRRSDGAYLAVLHAGA